MPGRPVSSCSSGATVQPLPRPSAHAVLHEGLRGELTRGESLVGLDGQPSTVMRNAAVKGSPAGASRRPSCERSALRGRGHRLEADQVLAGGREDLRVRVALEELDAERAAAAGDGERGARRLGHRVGVVERAVLERAAAEARGLLLAGRDQVLVEQEPVLRRAARPPTRRAARPGCTRYGW